MPRGGPAYGADFASGAQIRAAADPAKSGIQVWDSSLGPKSRARAFALLAGRGQSSKVYGGHAVAVLAASSRFLGHAYISIGAK
jgi:hypothetical protein